MESNPGGKAVQLGNAVIESIREHRFDEAEALLERLCEVDPAARSLLIFPVAIAIRRGRPAEAWQLVNGLRDDESPGLKALCLHALGDPLWHGSAVEHQDSPDPYVRRAMRGLLGLEVEANDIE